jgi:HEAT repeat protein
VVGSQAGVRVRLEPIPAVAVLFRVANQRVEKVRVFSASCPLDAGGLPFVWIDNVPPAASLAYLPGLIKDASNEALDGTIVAIAQHDDPQADVLLKQLSSPSQPEKVREKTVFWLGAARGSNGVALLKDILAHDGDEHIRDKAVFALSISKQPDALEWLMGAAKNDPSPHVRSQALFWLAQKAGKQAVAAISDAIQNDPDREVKERAVFALSQLPRDESIPKLIEIARTQRNPEVRKKAFFWLGQSNDPRALAFFEEVLAK